jgi:hypothetical protein
MVTRVVDATMGYRAAKFLYCKLDLVVRLAHYAVIAVSSSNSSSM